MSRGLSELMEFDHVIRIREGGEVDGGWVDGIWAPDVRVATDRDGQITDDGERDMIGSVRREGWELLTGFTGQYRYSGPIMHPAEYIGGALAEHIRTTPGLYAAVVVYLDFPDDVTEDAGDDDVAGWAVAYREES